MAEALKPMGKGLTFTGMTHKKLTKGFDLQFTSTDKEAKTFLCVGTEENRVDVTGTTQLSRQDSVLKAIDDFGKWGENVSLWMVAEILFSIKHLPAPGYGKQLCDALGATKCDLEQIKQKDLKKMFQDDVIDYGYYVLFSEGHVLLYDSYKNVLNEFNYGGFKATPAAMRLEDKWGLWWMRKLSADKGVFFQ